MLPRFAQDDGVFLEPPPDRSPLRYFFLGNGDSLSVVMARVVGEMPLR
ncbi:hypothetical protein CfE428DRAFT_6178 [Chthoniobacter flavus Ellin428]|uniref:Uncharacterized protein n=1 Tax=Chthoniobacter flavus Ellin428 TaxID=497964 RepID=B4DB87_9BACT|nr:hypothetical protein CfE428DRAFT_6178 [Chthoniobacter flavus Ellin428]